MARRNIWTNTPTPTINAHTYTVPVHEALKPNAINKERYPAFRMNLEEEVLQALMSGSLANLYYANAKENVAMFIDAFNRIEPEILAKSIMYAREKGFTRTIPIAATVVLSRRDLTLFRKIVHRVMLTPHDWRQFIDICRSKEIRPGIGRALKREIQKALVKMNIYQIIKYPTDVYDMINISRPSCNMVQEKPANIDKIISYIKRTGDNEEPINDRLIEAAREIKNIELPEERKAKIIKDNGLPYEYVKGTVEMTPKIWESLLYTAPYRNLINNLNNFGKNDVFNNPENLKYAITSIMNPDRIRSARLFPFRFYNAWRTVGCRTEYGGCEIPFIGLHEIKNALQKALEISVDNIPEISGHICIAPDISGSMTANVINKEDKSIIRCIDLVGLFTGIIMKKCRSRATVLPFEDTINLDLARRIGYRETIFDIATEFHAGGGTSLSAPVQYLRHTNQKVDRIIAFTDEEEWVGSSFVDEFYLYKTQIAPKCKAYLVKLIPSPTDAAPPNIQDINFVYGWTESVLKYVTSDLESQMDEVKKIDL